MGLQEHRQTQGQVGAAVAVLPPCRYGTDMNDEFVVFACPVCQQPISRPVAPLPSEQAVCVEDGKPAVPAGRFVLSDDDHWTDSAGCPLLNLSDLTGVQYHPDLLRNSGCCGRDGCDGPNLLCLAGHEVGTERSDCWMAHAAVLLPSVIQRTAEGFPQ